MGLQRVRVLVTLLLTVGGTLAFNFHSQNQESRKDHVDRPNMAMATKNVPSDWLGRDCGTTLGGDGDVPTRSGEASKVRFNYERRVLTIRGDTVYSSDTTNIMEDTIDDTDLTNISGDTVTIDSDTTKISGDTVTIDSDTTKVMGDTIDDTDLTNISGDTVTIDSDTTKVSGDTVTIDSDTTNISGDTVTIDSDTTKVMGDTIDDTDLTNISGDTVTIDSDTTKVSGDTVTIDSDTTKISGDTVTIDSDTTKISGDTVTIDSDTTKISGDTVTIDSDTTKISGDTVTIDSDTTKISGDTVTIDSDTTKVMGNTIDDTDLTNISGDTVTIDSDTTKIMGDTIDDTDLTNISGDTVIIDSDMTNISGGKAEGEEESEGESGGELDGGVLDGSLDRFIVYPGTETETETDNSLSNVVAFEWFGSERDNFIDLTVGSEDVGAVANATASQLVSHPPTECMDPTTLVLGVQSDSWSLALVLADLPADVDVFVDYEGQALTIPFSLTPVEAVDHSSACSVLDTDGDDVDDFEDVDSFNSGQTTRQRRTQLQEGVSFTKVDATVPICMSASDTNCVSGTQEASLSLVLAKDDTTATVDYEVTSCEVGYVKDQKCLPCPTGAICPGGGLLWNLPGYWARSERSLSVLKCRALDHERCPGYIKINNIVHTAVCGRGFAGVRCDDCLDGWYKDNHVCYDCDEQKDEVGIVVFALFIYFVCLLSALCLLNTKMIDLVAWVLLSLQIFGSLQRMLVADEPPPRWVASLFNFFEVLLFDVSFVRAECWIGSSSFLLRFWGTYCVVVMLTAILVATLTIKQRRQIAQARSDFKTSKVKEERVKRRAEGRLIRGLFILGTFAYSNLVTMALQALDCTTLEGKLVLHEETKLECWSGAHVIAGLVAVVTVIAGCIGPLYAVRKVIRLKDEALKKRNEERFGFNYSPYNKPNIWFFGVDLMLNFSIGVASSFLREHPNSLVGLQLIMMTSIIILVGVRKPFLSPFELIFTEVRLVVAMCALCVNLKKGDKFIFQDIQAILFNVTIGGMFLTMLSYAAYILLNIPAFRDKVLKGQWVKNVSRSARDHGGEDDEAEKSSTGGQPISQSTKTLATRPPKSLSGSPKPTKRRDGSKRTKSTASSTATPQVAPNSLKRTSSHRSKSTASLDSNISMGLSPEEEFEKTFKRVVASLKKSNVNVRSSITAKQLYPQVVEQSIEKAAWKKFVQLSLTQ